MVEVNPLVPAGIWDWFCLDNVPYHGRIVTILWDKTGAKYGKGKGLRVFADGREIARSEIITRIEGKLATIVTSPGGRPVHLIEYGNAEKLD
jgi:hypothetical protein